MRAVASFPLPHPTPIPFGDPVLDRPKKQEGNNIRVSIARGVSRGIKVQRRRRRRRRRGQISVEATEARYFTASEAPLAHLAACTEYTRCHGREICRCFP